MGAGRIDEWRCRAGIVGGFLLALAGCGLVVTEIPSPLKEELAKDAQEVTADLADGRVAAVTAKFTPQMTTALPGDKLSTLWLDLERDIGPFVEQGATRGAHVRGFDVIFVTCHFARGKMDLQVTYDNERMIAGLYLRPGS